MKNFKSILLLASIFMAIPSNLICMEFCQKQVSPQDKQLALIKTLEKSLELFRQKNDLSQISKPSIFKSKGFLLQTHDASNTALAVFELPHASKLSPISNQEANKAHQLLKVYKIENKNSICSVMFDYFSKQLLPLTKEQATFLLLTPLLQETVRTNELASPSFLSPEQKQILSYTQSQHTGLILVQRAECKAFLESGKLIHIFKLESGLKSSAATTQTMAALNHILSFYHKCSAIQRVALTYEANTYIDKICDLAMHEGFALGMIVHTNGDPKKIEDIQIGDLVRSQDLTNDLQVVCPVTHICKEIIPCYVEIILEHETITTALGQKFYLEKLNDFVTAQELIQSPELQAQFPEAILEIRQVNQSIEVYKLTVAHEHNFYVTEKQLLAHNFIPMVTVVGAAVPSIVIPIAKGFGAAAFGWIGSRILRSFIPSKKECDKEWQKHLEQQKKEGVAKKDKNRDHDNKKSKGKGKESELSGGADAPGDKEKEKPKAEEGKKEPKDEEPKEAQAPGKPTEKDGFIPPKKWDGKKVKHKRGYGWPDKQGNIWIPSGPQGHGGPHWDVQVAGGGYVNIVPGGGIRGEK